MEIEPDPDGRSATYVVLLPRWNVDADFDERVRREARLLARLGEEQLPFRIPKIAGVVSERGHPVLVESTVPGFELDLRAGRQSVEKPWEVVGELAAAVHELDPAVVEVGHETRRAHAQAKLSSFEGLDDPLVLDAQAWAREHLPPATESVFLHGDLLGQNIMLHPEETFGIIDWEFATRGDPAEDLAIVTRGVRRPFQIEDGLDRLLDAYARAGGTDVTATEVHFHELCLVTRQYRASLDPQARGHAPEQELNMVRGVLRRAMRHRRGS